MRDLVLEALNQAFQSEIAHAYSIISRELKDRGGHASAAKTLKIRVDNLLLYHQHIVDLINGETT